MIAGLCVGLGLFFVLLWLTSPLAPQRDDVQPSLFRGHLDRAGLTGVAAWQLPFAMAAAFGVGFVAVYVVSLTPPVAATFGLMAGYAPWGWLSARARRRSAVFLEVWPEAIDNLASAVRAGLSLPEGVIQLGERGPEELRPWFQQFEIDYQSGLRFSDCLDQLKDRMADPTGDRVVEGLRVARDVGGGDLGRLLRNLSGHLRDEVRTRAELQARQSWSLNGARLAVASPWLVLLMLSFQQDVITRYASVTGSIILIGGALVCLVSYRAMLWIGRLPSSPRVLA